MPIARIKNHFLINPGVPRAFADELAIDSTQQACQNTEALGAL